MRSVRRIFVACGILMAVFTAGCGKSSKLGALLPDAPAGWKAAGVNYNDVRGVGHSAARDYEPTSGGSGVQKVTVQILFAEKDADSKKLQAMSIEKHGSFKERKEVNGLTAFESVPLPDNEEHSLDVIVKPGAWVQIIAYRGGAGWEKPENRQAAVSAFASKLDWKKIAAQE
jgi:hypothetical protein